MALRFTFGAAKTSPLNLLWLGICLRRFTDQEERIFGPVPEPVSDNLKAV